MAGFYPPEAYASQETLGGEGGIRTPDTVARMPHFECGAFNHSATSPEPETKQPVQNGAIYLAKGMRANNRYSAPTSPAFLTISLQLAISAAMKPLSSAGGGERTATSPSRANSARTSGSPMMALASW